MITLAALALSSITFVPGGTTVDHAWLDAYPGDDPIQVLGYYCADDVLPISTQDDLLQLAEQRAVSLKGLLVEQGVDADRVSTMAYGRTRNGKDCQATAITQAHAPVVGGSWGFLDQPVVGVGLALGSTDGLITVDKIIPGSPAAEDGEVQVGDRITEVQVADGAPWQSLEGLTINEVVSLIRGPQGSGVGLRFERNGLEIHLIREPIQAAP